MPMAGRCTYRSAFRKSGYRFSVRKRVFESLCGVAYAVSDAGPPMVQTSEQGLSGTARELGRLGETATLRTMARRIDGADQALAELKAVDATYPLAGEVTVEGGHPFAEAIAGNGAIAALVSGGLSILRPLFCGGFWLIY